jgi:hypothetical protein
MAAQTDDNGDATSNQQQDPIAVRREKMQMRGAYFPLGYKEAFGQWVSNMPIDATSTLRLLTTNSGPA